MIYLLAFVLGGAFCLITQLMAYATKKSVPFILTAVIIIGTLLALPGWTDWMGGWGSCGLFLSLYGAGAGLYQNMMLAFDGDFVPIIRYTVLVLYVFAMSILCGVILHRRGTGKAQAAVHDEEVDASDPATDED